MQSIEHLVKNKIKKEYKHKDHDIKVNKNKNLISEIILSDPLLEAKVK